MEKYDFKTDDIIISREEIHNYVPTLAEKVGYGFGDLSSSILWKVFSYYLPLFYSDIYGLSLSSTALLFLVVRIWDAVSDPFMGLIVDRTETRWGKFRPYLMWMAIPFAVSAILLFTTPPWGETGKLIWAYTTYILMMTTYTAINVPYGALLSVMTDDSDQRTNLACYRMFFAFAGSFVAMFAWEPLCNFLSSGTDILSIQDGWRNTMVVFAIVAVILFLLSFMSTHEHVYPLPSAPVFTDIKNLLLNRPWWMLTCTAMCTNLGNTIRGLTAAYYFKYYVGGATSIDIGIGGFLIFAGLFLAIGEGFNMVGTVIAAPTARRFGKKTTFIASSVIVIILSVIFFYLPVTNIGFILMMFMQILLSVFTGIVAPLVWSMYTDVSDYSMYKHGYSSTGIIFSSGTMAQKLGGALASSSVLWFFDYCGLQPNEPDQTEMALTGLRLAMSYIPAAITLVMVIALCFYPLSKSRMTQIYAKLSKTLTIE